MILKKIQIVYVILTVFLLGSIVQFMSFNENENNYIHDDIGIEISEKADPIWTTGLPMIKEIAISAEGDYIAAATDGRVYLFHSSNSTPLWIYNTGINFAAVDISADGNYIVAGSYDNFLYLFNKNSSTPIWSYDGGADIRRVSISADGNYIAASTYQKLCFFERTSSVPLWIRSGGIDNIDMSSNGTYIVTETGNYVIFFNKTSSTPLWSYNTGEGIYEVAISADGSYMVACNGRDKDRVYLFHKSSSIPLWDYKAGQNVYSVDISSDGNYIIAGTGYRTVHLFERTNPTPIQNYDTPASAVSVSISSDGSYFTAGTDWGSDDRLFFYDKISNESIWDYPVSGVNSVVISENGKYIALASGNTQLSLIYTCPPNPPSLTSDAGNPETDGSFNLSWSISGNFAKFAIYTNTDYINDINDTVSLLYDNIQDLSYLVSTYSGIHYYVVVAFNGSGHSISNCISVDVQIVPQSFILSTNARNPDTDGNYDLFWTQSLGANYYNVYSSDQYIFDINHTITLLQSGIVDLNYSISSQPYREYYHIVVAFNEYGNASSNNVYINVNEDLEAPIISILSPIPYQLFGNHTFDFNVSIIDGNLNSTWYSLNGGENHSFTGSIGTINHTAWMDCEHGNVRLKFYANDTSANLDNEEIIIRKDIYLPDIIIHSPIPHQLCGLESPKFNISIISHEYDTAWYSLNGGYNNSISSFTGKVNQTAWESCGNGTTTFNLHARNLAGNITSKELIVRKETHVPQIIIHEPISNNIIGRKAPLFNISIDESFLHENWYSLNDNQNFTFTGNIGRINQELWDSCNNGTVKITFYANNTANNIGKAEVFVQKDINILSPRVAYAIVVGIEDYQGTNSDLNYCGDDAEDVYSLLIAECNFEPENIILLLNSNATDLAIDNAFSQIKNRISTEDVFLFYFSGHGGVDSRGEFLCPYDSIEPFNPSRTYYDYVLEVRLNGIKCAEKFVLTDACNSGGLIFECQATGTYIMTSCMDYEICYESSELEHGIFTYYFLRSLDHATDSNHDGIISLEEQYHYIYSNTFLESGYESRPQESDRITGESVLYPGVGALTFTFNANYLNISFYLYGNGMLNSLNITICSVIPNITIKTLDILEIYATSTSGFGFYELTLELPIGCNVTGCEIIIEIEGNSVVSFTECYGDYDGDGLTDLFEIREGGGLDPSTNDTDNDGLNDYDEFYGNTDPLVSDSDDDGLLDGEEVNVYNTDPNLSDTDNDGLIDGEEVNVYNTDPNLSDTDNDDLLDGEEINTYNTNPLQWDTDQDGYSDGDEVLIHHTDPLDPNSYPRSDEIPTSILGFNWFFLVGIAMFLLILLRKVKSFLK
jgi:hypothetical protein